MIAQRRGMCSRCDEFIQPGDEIEPAPGGPGSGFWAHVVCPDASEPAPDVADLEALTQPCCSHCTTNHPGEC